MDDSFFAATTDLDRILDEFEEKEVPGVPNTKSTAIKKNVTSPAKHVDICTKPINVTKHSSQEPAWDAIDNSAVLPNGLKNKQSALDQMTPSNCETDLLIDFADTPVEPSVAKLQNQNNLPAASSELDFLLTLIPEPMHNISTNATNNTLNRMPENAFDCLPEVGASSESSHAGAEEITKNISHQVPNAPKVVETSSRADVQDEALLNEFESFMAADDATQPTLIHEPENAHSEEAEPCHGSVSNGLSHANAFNAPQPQQDTSSSNLDHIGDDASPQEYSSDESDESSETSAEMTLPDEIDCAHTDHVGVRHEVDVEQPSGANPETCSNSEVESTFADISDPYQEVQEPRQVSTQNDQTTNSASSPSVGGRNSEESYPDFSPPPYSAVLAEDRAAQRQIAQQRLEVAEPSRGVQSQETEPSNPGNLSQDTISYDGAGHINQPSIATTSVQVLPRPGKRKPVWVPDKESPACTMCGVAFSFTKRRHHCRVCGQIFCSTCCNERAKLEYMEFAEARVCVRCHAEIMQADASAESARINATMSSPQMPSPPPSAPRPVLKPTDSEGSDSGNNLVNAKSVRFSDGTRPDHPSTLPATPPLPSRMSRASRARQRNLVLDGQASPFPPVIVDTHDDGSFVIEEYPDQALISTLLHPNNLQPLRFALGPNLYVSLRIVKYLSINFFYFLSHGLDSVGQAEVAFILQVETSNANLPLHAFTLFSFLFTNSRKGKAIHALDFVPASDMVSEEQYFGVADLVGVLFVRKTFQAITLVEENDPMFSSLTVKPSSTLFALLVHKSEKPWATLFPSRLLLGLGAHCKEFPYPVANSLQRKPVYRDTGSTILGILCDFRNFKYKVVAVPGLSVIIKEHGILINIPANRFNEIVKILNSSNEHVLALGSDELSTQNEQFRSHLCAVQDPSNLSYRTEVLKRHPCEVEDISPDTGAAFIVFNGSLKSGNAQQARCTVVEDGVMVQILPEKMTALKESLKAMDDFMISCNQPGQDVSAAKPAARQNCQFVEVRWIADDTKFNIGLSSPIDFTSFEGIIGYNVQGKSEKKGKQQVLRWNQVFFFKSTGDVVDMSRLAEQMASGCFQALVPQMRVLRSSRQTKIGIRFNIHPDDVGYAVGSQGMPLPDPCLNALDEQLIFLLHDASANLQPDDDVVVFELIFCVLEMRSNWKTMQ